MKNNRSSFFFAVIVFLSGIAGLSYELIWIRSIKGYFGNEIFSISMVVTLYFLGLGLGGIFGSRYLKRGGGPLRLYIIIESLIAVFGILFPVLIQLVHHSYLSLTAITPPDYWLSLKAIHIVFLLIAPTTLIGITLPLIAAIVVHKPEVFTARFSLYYGLNTFGAVVGSIICGLILIPKFGLAWSGRAIAACNIGVVILCYGYIREFAPVGLPVYSGKTKWKEAVLPCTIAFLMGFLALAYEIAWIRCFGFYFITSTISLAILLSIFLVGLALGSVILSFWKQSISIFQLGLIELAKALFMVGSILLVRKVFFQDWGSIETEIAIKNNVWYLYKYYLIFATFAFLLPGIFMGITFPLIEKIWPSANAGAGNIVGLVAAWNTWGGAMGSLMAGLLLISALGSTNTLILTICISLILSIILFIYTKKYFFIGIPVVIGVLILIFVPKELNWKRTPENLPRYVYYTEGKMGSVSVLKSKFGNKTLEMDNSYVLGGTSIVAVRIQDHQGALPVLLNTKTNKKVLKIGEGTGITSLSCAENNNIAQLDIVEIVPEVIETLPYFSYYNKNIWNLPTVKIHKGDGREFLALSDQKYDVILGELYSPLIAGTANLYSIEHYKNIKAHLAPKGLFCQWIQSGQFSPEMFKIVVRTFQEVFGKGSLWVANTSYKAPLIGLIYSDDEFWSVEKLKQGLNQYSEPFKKSMGWVTSEDIGMCYLSSNLTELADGENRLNSINHPYVEEIAARSLLAFQPSPLTWFMNKKHWPSEWSGWTEGRIAWEKQWELMIASLSIFERRITDADYLKLMKILNTLPNTPSLNIYKADILNTLTEDYLVKSNLFKSKNEFYTFLADFYINTIHLDPENYNYHRKLLHIYKILDDKEKLQNEFPVFWNVLPDILKTEEVYSNIKNQIQ